MPDRRHRAYTFLISGVVLYSLIGYVLPTDELKRIWLMLAGAVMAIAMLGIGFSVGEDRMRRDAIRRNGVELEAEVLGAYEAGAPRGSDLARARQLQMSAEDLLELELRYQLDGREIVSRNRVSPKVYFHSRGAKTVKIKVSPERPEEWIEAV